MIKAVFSSRGGCLTGFTVSGHAGYAGAGEDIVCASVSSAVQLTANGITEVLRQKAEVSADYDTVALRLAGSPSREASYFLEALRLHLELLREDYPKNIDITCSEV